jgi:hypothetical protein
MRNADKSNLALPVVRRSACASPSALANLKPCPEHALDTST